VPVWLSCLAFPDIKHDPDLALALFVAPVLLDSAYGSSPRDLRRSWLPISSLVSCGRWLTVAAGAGTAHWLEPALPWAAAFALGAIVAPPDAAQPRLSYGNASCRTGSPSSWKARAC
jgi:NhaP-type Na+/H+ or K+/H+ antiporter